MIDKLSDISSPLLSRFDWNQNDKAAVSNSQMLRSDVLRNIKQILTSKQFADSDGYLLADSTTHQRVRASVLNFGIPEFVGSSNDGLSLRKLCDEIRTALINHEPRLVASSVKVELDSSSLNEMQLLLGNKAFRIEADIDELGTGLRSIQLDTIMHPFRAPEVVADRRDR